MNRETNDHWSVVTPSDLFRAIRTRLFSVVITTVIVAVVVAGLLVAWPNRYGSDGLMYVRLGRSAIAIDPTTKSGGSISMQDSRKAEVISIGSMIGSREIAERTVANVGVEKINAPRTWIEKLSKRLTASLPVSSKTAGDLSAEDYAERVEVEEAIKKVQDAIDIDITKDAYTLTVGSKFSDPFVAQAITQSVMDEYGRYHVEAHQSTGSLKFFEEQVTSSQDAAVTARTALQDSKTKMGWLSSESAELTMRDRIVNLETALDNAKSELAESESQTKELSRRLEVVKEWVPVDVMKVPSASGDSMRSQLYDLQVAESDELSKISESHPRYRMLKEKMEQSRKIFSDQGEESEQSREALNPVHQELQTQYQVTLAKSEGLRSRCQSLQESLTETNAQLRRLNQDVITLEHLTWEADIAEANYRRHAASLEDARVDTALNDQEMTDVSIVQDASLNLKKVSPPRGLLAGVGVLLGLCLGCLQAVLRDSPDDHRRGHHRRDYAANTAHASDSESDRRDNEMHVDDRVAVSSTQRDEFGHEDQDSDTASPTSIPR